MVQSFPDAISSPLLHDLLSVSLTALNVLSPVFGADEEIEDFTLEYVNPAGQRMTGLSERPGGTLLTRFPHTLAAGILAYYRRVYAEGATSLHEVNYQADGLDNYFRLAARRSGDLLVVSFTDTSDQDRSAVEEALRQSQAREQAALAAAEHERNELRDFVEQAPVAVAVYRGSQYCVEAANATTLAIWDRSWAEVRHRPVFELLPEAASPQVRALFDQVYLTGTPHTAHEQPTTLNRHGRVEVVYWSFVFQPQRQPNGQITGIVSIGTDVSEQVQARQAAEASTRQLRLITDALPVLIGYLDREEKYRFANRAYEPWFHRPTQEILGRAIREIAGAQAYPSIQPYIARALRGERVEFEVKMPFRKDFIKHIHTTYIPDVQHGQVLGFYTLVADVTDQVEARQAAEASTHQAQALARELATANEQLRRTNVDLDNFIYTASHDLKQPIANIEGLLHALEHELPPEGRVGQVPYMLALMQESIERFGRTISHLTELSRLQKENEQSVTQVKLARVLEEVQLDLAPLLAQTGAQVDVSVPEETLLTFSQKNLRSIVYNLPSNALKYHHPDRPPRVQVRYYPQERFHLLEVQDNGLGLDLAQDKLFGMFKRLHTHVEGTGVGLHMVKRMVENAGGRIEVQSQLSQGSAFRVYIPRF